MTDYTMDEIMSSNTPDSFNTTSETTTETANSVPSEASTELNVFDSIPDYDVPSKTTDESAERIQISNVAKPVGRDGKPDINCFDVILVKLQGGNRKATVYYDATRTVKTVDAVPGQEVGERLPDGGVIVAMSKGKEQRVYATVHLTVDDLADKFDGLVWEPRHKTRKPKGKNEEA